ncbi:MAG: 2'-5' RNA ligase family protein [Acidimicrobiales bacterium]|nr:2'-5' RNA ligase family protein [Acidimicrobiales bacterium]
MEHLVALLDADHDREVDRLSHDLADALGIDEAAMAHGRPHITLVSYTGLAPAAAGRALPPVVRDLDPVAVRAHGYGVFCGDADSELSLHVMVVRTRALDELHRRTHAAVVTAGGRPDGTTAPEVWTPHITLLDRGLTPALLGQAVEILAQRPHRSWSLALSEVAVTRRARAAGEAAGPAYGPTIALG